MNLYNLTATLTLDDKDYKEGMKESKQEAEDFSKKSHKSGIISAKSFMKIAAAVGVAAGALYKLTTSTIDFGDDIDKNSQKLGMSKEAYQKWSKLLELSGTNIDVMKEGMKSFNGILDNASKGQADALLTLEELGLGYENFANLSVEDAFKLVVEQLQDMEDGTKKTALAQKLFGGAGQELMPILSDERGSVDELFKKFEDLGIIMSDDVVDASVELKDELTLLKDQFKTMLNQIGVALYPLVESVIDFIKKVKESEITKNIMDSLSQLGEHLKDLKPLFDIIKNILEELFKLAGKGFNSFLEDLDTIVLFLSGDFEGAIENAKNNIIDRFKAVGDFFKSWIGNVKDIYKKVFGFLDDALTKIFDHFGLSFEEFKKPFKAFINFFIDGINALIKGANKFSINIPDWVPKIGGKTFGINIPLIPRLQRGLDYVPKDMYPAYLDAGERVLTRAENKQYNAVGGAEGIAALVNGIVGASQMSGNSGAVNVNLQVQIGNKEIKDFIYKTVDDKMKSQGFKSLKKVGAYND